jgi:F-type H+-transporting ATPase subunit a
MHHITGELLGKTVNIDTLFFAWACMGLIVLFSLFFTTGVSADTAKYGIRQHFAESLYDFIRGITKEQIGKRADHYVFFIGSIFIFILFSYYAGLMPWKMGSLLAWWPQAHGHAWHGASPCADLNVPAGMALVVVLVYFLSGAYIGGFKYVQSFLPINFSSKGISINLMCLIEIMDLAVRPLTLSLRLFANTVAGETLLATFVSLVALILPVFVLGFEMAVGLLQAFLFTILSTVYIGTAVHHAEHLAHEHH